MFSPTGLLLVLVAIVQISLCQPAPLRGPPQFEVNPQYSESYIPASMQIIAYLTELMKYELRPTTGTTTTTSPRPTPSHRPGLYAPNAPLGPESYFAQRNSFQEYVQGLGLFTDEFRSNKDTLDDSDSSWTDTAIGQILKQLEPSLRSTAIKDLELFGQGPTDLYRLVNGLGNEGEKDEDVRLQKFSNSYDDSNVYHVARFKKTPPTRAYVTLLSLYDLLNKESKKIGLNKFNGYSSVLLKDLGEISTGTSSYQLKYVLEKIVEKRNTNDQTLLGKINSLLEDLGKEESYMNTALRYIPPLPFEN